METSRRSVDVKGEWGASSREMGGHTWREGKPLILPELSELYEQALSLQPGVQRPWGFSGGSNLEAEYVGGWLWRSGKGGKQWVKWTDNSNFLESKGNPFGNWFYKRKYGYFEQITT